MTTSLCSPPRASIITGRYAHSHGVLGVGIYSLLKQDENPSLPAELQAAAGYETALFGKWHLHGDSGGGKRRYPGAEKTWQAPRGFSTFNIVRGLGKYRTPIMYEGEFAESNAKEHSGHSSEVFAKLAIGWLEGTWKDRVRAPRHSRSSSTSGGARALAVPRAAAVDARWRERGRLAAAAVGGQRDVLGQRLGRARGRQRHHAQQPREAHGEEPPVRRRVILRNPDGLAGRTPLRSYGNGTRFHIKLKKSSWLGKVHRRLVVSYLRVGKAVDEAVGRLVDWVDTNGLRETTVVVYTSDQGYFLGQHQWYDKRYMHEPSIRAPLLLRYPPEVGAGSRASPLLLNVDIAPTLLDFAGVSAASSPDLRRMQGASFRRILAAAATPPHAAVRAAAAAAAAEPAGWRHAAYYRYFWDPFVPGVPGHFGLRTRAHKLIVYDGWIHGKGGECTGGGGGEGATSDTGGDGGGDGGDATGGGGGGGDAALVPFLGCFELFDLEADASERHNLAGRAEHAPTGAAAARAPPQAPGGAWRLAAAHAARAAAEEARAGATPRARRRCRREGRGVGDAAGARRDEPLGRARAVRGAQT